MKPAAERGLGLRLRLGLGLGLGLGSGFGLGLGVRLGVRARVSVSVSVSVRVRLRVGWVYTREPRHYLLTRTTYTYLPPYLPSPVAGSLTQVAYIRESRDVLRTSASRFSAFEYFYNRSSVAAAMQQELTDANPNPNPNPNLNPNPNPNPGPILKNCPLLPYA